MNINFLNFNSINFGKKHIAEVAVQKMNESGGYEPVKGDIFEIEPNKKEDRGYFDKLNKNWTTNGKFYEAIKAYFNFYNKRDKKKFYSLENKSGRPLCIAQTSRSDSFCSKIDGIKSSKVPVLDYIEVDPEFKYGNANREYKNLGKTMLAQIVSEVELSGGEGMWLIPDAKDFFNSTGCFEKSEIGNGIILRKEHFEDLISK